MKNKKENYFLLLSVFAIGIYFILPWVQYIFAINKSAVDWYQEQYIEKSFSGHIESINLFENNPYKIVLSINDGSDFSLSYGVTCVDETFNKFVKVGDSVYKKSGSTYIEVIKSDRSK